MIYYMPIIDWFFDIEDLRNIFKPEKFQFFILSFSVEYYNCFDKINFLKFYNVTYLILKITKLTVILYIFSKMLF